MGKKKEKQERLRSFEVAFTCTGHGRVYVNAIDEDDALAKAEAGEIDSEELIEYSFEDFRSPKLNC